MALFGRPSFEQAQKKILGYPTYNDNELNKRADDNGQRQYTYNESLRNAQEKEAEEKALRLSNERDAANNAAYRENMQKANEQTNPIQQIGREAITAAVNRATGGKTLNTSEPTVQQPTAPQPTAEEQEILNNIANAGKEIEDTKGTQEQAFEDMRETPAENNKLDLLKYSEIGKFMDEENDEVSKDDSGIDFPF